MKFENTEFAQFIASDAGRALRVAAGLTLIGAGLAKGGSAGGTLALLGLAPLGAGMFDLCLLSPLFGGPLEGSAIRAAGPASDAAEGRA